MIFGKLHGAILKLCRAFCEHAHGAGALYQISRVASDAYQVSQCHGMMVKILPLKQSL
jgi:hypothetical protein